MWLTSFWHCVLVARRKDACLHGAPPLASTAHLMGEVVALLQLDVSGAAAVAAVDAHARRSPQARHPDVRRVILCMGAWPRAAHHPLFNHFFC